MSIDVLGTVPNSTVKVGAINNAIVKGTTTSRWNVRSGGESQTVFKGTQAQVTTVAQECQTKGYEYSITGGHIWTITITFPVDIIINPLSGGDPPLLTTWELNFQPTKQNIFEAGDRIFISRIPNATKTLIETDIKANSSTTVVQKTAAGDKNVLSATVARNLKRIGVEGRNLFVPTLKRSVIISNTRNVVDTQAPWDISTNGKLFSTYSLLARYSNTGNIFKDIPPFIRSQLPYTLPLVTSTSGGAAVLITGYSQDVNGVVTFVGWLEFPPEYQTISLNKVQASQQWQFQKWSAGKYGLYDPYSIAPGAAEPSPSTVLLVTDNPP